MGKSIISSFNRAMIVLRIEGSAHVNNRGRVVFQQKGVMTVLQLQHALVVAEELTLVSRPYSCVFNRCGMVTDGTIDDHAITERFSRAGIRVTEFSHNKDSQIVSIRADVADFPEMHGQQCQALKEVLLYISIAECKLVFNGKEIAIG